MKNFPQNMLCQGPMGPHAYICIRAHPYITKAYTQEGGGVAYFCNFAYWRAMGRNESIKFPIVTGTVGCCKRVITTNDENFKCYRQACTQDRGGLIKFYLRIIQVTDRCDHPQLDTEYWSCVGLNIGVGLKGGFTGSTPNKSTKCYKAQKCIKIRPSPKETPKAGPGQPLRHVRHVPRVPRSQGAHGIMPSGKNSIIAYFTREHLQQTLFYISS